MINDIGLNETVVSLQVDPSTDAKYGFWRNEIGIFICTANWLFIQNMLIIMNRRYKQHTEINACSNNMSR
jgi:hypothetical protein